MDQVYGEVVKCNMVLVVINKRDNNGGTTLRMICLLWTLRYSRNNQVQLLSVHMVETNKF